MKKIILPALLIISIGLFSSCAKKTSSPANNNPTAALSANIAGTSWSANTTTATANSVTITIKGTATDGSYIQLSLAPTVTPGTYSFSQSGNYTCQYNTGVASYLVTTGSIVVTKYTKNSIITGTFSCTVADAANSSNTKSVTQGSFTGLF